MKLISYKHNGRETWGALLAGNAPEPAAQMGVIDLGQRTGYATLASALAADALQAAQSAMDGEQPDCQYADIQLLVPVPAPEKVVCVGVNYADRNAEYKDNASEASYPSLFIRFIDSLVPYGQPVKRPPESEQLDYEGEIVIVIGKGGRRISEQNAHSHIAGLSVMNEGTLRDWLRHAKFNVTQGKNFVASGAFGPWLVTADECPEFTSIGLQTTVNGELRQQDNTRRMAYPFAYLLAYISTFMVLKPGDVIATGTPTGAGARFDPPKWLVPGDEIVVTVDGVGALRNRVEDEGASA